MGKNPLVSVIVITYNSSEFIYETLESVYRQTYDNLEIIISDDCSSDNTIQKVNEWIDKNKQRFTRALLIETSVNTGTAANNNRAIKSCKGEYIRGVAGDDIIPERAIEYQVHFFLDRPSSYLLNGYSINFKINNGVRKSIPSKKIIDIEPQFYEMSATDQYRYMLTHDHFGLTEGTMVRRYIYDEITMYDEKYTLIEDMPFWLNVTRKGFKYDYIDTPTLLYRIHDSVVHAGDGVIFNKRFLDIKRQIREDMVKPNISVRDWRCWERFAVDDILYWLVFRIFKNRPSLLSKIIISFFYKIRLQ